MNERQEPGKITLPIVPEDLAEGHLYEATVQPEAFIRREARIMVKQNPMLLDVAIAGALMAQHQYGEEAGILYIKPSLYLDACFRNARMGDSSKPIIIEYETIANCFGQLDSEAKLRALEVLSTNFPVLHEKLSRIIYMGRLLGISEDALSETLSHYVACFNCFLDQSRKPVKTEADKSDVEPERKSSIMPLVERNTAREAFIEIILNKDKFIEDTMERLAVRSLDMAARLEQTASAIDRELGEYLLFASLTVRCLMDAFEKQGIPFPTVTEDSIRSQYKEATLMVGSDPKQGAQMIRKIQEANLKSMRDNNPHLFSAVNMLGSARNVFGTPRAVSAMNGAVHPYSSIRNQLEIDDLRKKVQD